MSVPDAGLTRTAGASVVAVESLSTSSLRRFQTLLMLVHRLLENSVHSTQYSLIAAPLPARNLTRQTPAGRSRRHTGDLLSRDALPSPTGIRCDAPELPRLGDTREGSTPHRLRAPPSKVLAPWYPCKRIALQ